MVDKLLHMAGGTGKTSYAANSTLQRRLSQDALYVIKKAADLLIHTIPASQGHLVVADLGCSTGDNALFIFSEIADSISKACSKLGQDIPEIQLFLNDLPGNDFNTLLDPVLSSYKKRMNESAIRDGLMPYFVAAVSGSFYKRLFPSSSVHFVNSSASLHWLSQAPPGLNNETEGAVNAGSIYIPGKNPLVSKLYLEQFQRDFATFLKHRSEELCSEGHMALTLFGRIDANAPSDDTAAFYSWLDEALENLILKGLLKASDVASFNIPCYFPTLEEVKLIIQTEGSFDILQSNVIESSYSSAFGVLKGDTKDRSEKVVLILRAALGSILASHFGDSIMDEFISTLTEVVSRRFHEYCEYKWINVAISLKKRGM